MPSLKDLKAHQYILGRSDALSFLVRYLNGDFMHRPFGLDLSDSDTLFDIIAHSEEVEKTRLVRLYISALMIINKVVDVVNAGDSFAFAAPDCLKHYLANAAATQFKPNMPKMETAQT